MLSTTTAGNIVTVNMNSAFDEINGTDTELAVGQIVATVAAANGNGTGMLFQIEGQRTSVPVANGSEVAGPVYVIDFLDVPPYARRPKRRVSRRARPRPARAPGARPTTGVRGRSTRVSPAGTRAR